MAAQESFIIVRKNKRKSNKMLEAKTQKHLDLLVDRYPQLSVCKEDIKKHTLFSKNAINLIKKTHNCW